MLIDSLEGVIRATERVAAIGGNIILNASVYPHSLHRLATVKHEVDLWLFLFGCNVQFSFLCIHFSKILFLCVALESSYLN